jgi:fucose permease
VAPNKRTIGQSYFGVFATLGYLCALLLPERIASLISWKGSFLVEAVVTLAIAALLAKALSFEQPRFETSSGSLKDSLDQPHLYLLGLAQILTYGVMTALSTWTTAFLWKEQGMGIEWAGPLAALGIVGSLIGRLIGAGMTTGRERMAILLAGFATAACVFLLPRAPGLIPTVIVLMLAYLSSSYSFGAIFAYGMMVSTRGTPGRNISIITVVANIGALAFPPLVGYVLDTAGSFNLGFTIVAVIGVVGSLVVAAFLPRPRAKGA